MSFNSRRFKLNECTALLTQMGVTWNTAEAAAKATGAKSEEAAELVFSGALCFRTAVYFMR